MHVLLIEPDKVLAATYAQALLSAGHQVTVVGSAQAAIDAADAHKPDLVVLELQLATHNGVEFLYEFRSYPEWQQVPVIAHTWVPRQTGIAEQLSQQLGVVAYHYKPQTSLHQLIMSTNKFARAPS